MSTATINRTVFLVDGFNLYHSIRRAQRDYQSAGQTPPSMKWLNLRALCQSYMHLLGKSAQLTDVYYCSALATHLTLVKPDVMVRHQTLIDAMRATGVTIELGRFKEKSVWCTHCGNQNIRHEEKETDVAISIKLLELFFTDSCDTVVFVTGDTDVAPAVRTAQRLFAQKRVVCAFPHARKNKELATLAPGSFSLSKEQYAKHQFPDPFLLPNGSTISKPSSW